MPRIPSFGSPPLLVALRLLYISSGNHACLKEILMVTIMPLAAIGFSLLYLFLGGGLGGAVLIFIVAKMFGK